MNPSSFDRAHGESAGKPVFRLAHIVNPVRVGPDSDLFIAQPITFQTMRTAVLEAWKRGLAVELFSAQYPEDRDIVPDFFSRTPDLERSILDFRSFAKNRKLPLIKDILDRLFQASTADYFIFTNVDIALQPFFYLAVASFIQAGHDAFTINRRTIPGHYRSVAEIPLMYAEPGDEHKGYDCFVFARGMYSRFVLGEICVGTAGIGRALLANLVFYSKYFREFRDRHLTFHIGDNCDWRNTDYADYQQENWREYLRLFERLEASGGRLEPVWRSYLLDVGAARKFPDFHAGPGSAL